jgi:hypothetical protein
MINCELFKPQLNQIIIFTSMPLIHRFLRFETNMLSLRGTKQSRTVHDRFVKYAIASQ